MIDSSVLFGMDGIIYGMARPFFLFKWNYVITERSNEMFKWSQHWRHRRPHTQLPNHNVRTFNASEGWLEGESLLILSQFFSYCSSPVLIKTYCTSAFDGLCTHHFRQVLQYVQVSILGFVRR